jgi:hypothetical protein
MPNRRLGWLLFLSAYSPVFALLAIRAYDRVCAIVVLALILLVAATLGVAALFFVIGRTEPQQMRLVTVEQRDGDVAGFLVAYLLPFVGVVAGGWRDVLAVALVIALIGVVYVNSRMIYVNPLLALFGYHLIMIRATTDPRGRPAESLTPQFLVTRRRWLRPDETFTARSVTGEALFALPRDEKNDATE